MTARKKITIGWRIRLDFKEHDGSTGVRVVGIGDVAGSHCTPTSWRDSKYGVVYTTRRAAHRIRRAMIRETGKNAAGFRFRLCRVVRWV